MTTELKNIHLELTNLAEEFNLKKPKDLEFYLEENIEDFELIEDLIDDDYQMLSIDNFDIENEEEFNMDSLLEEESELFF